MESIRSFAPISDARAQRLILGSMPGKASLSAAQYYAHPRNAFWKIIEYLFGIDADLPYPKRLGRLVDNRVALWDVMRNCQRASSLDSDIVEPSIVANDFATFFDAHPEIRCVYFNGAKAESTYRRHVAVTLSDGRPLEYQRLPSTSPAHASLTLSQKIAAWDCVARNR